MAAPLSASFKTTFFDDIFHLPLCQSLDFRLLAGAAIFGIGWGLGGYCPGPLAAALPLAADGTIIFAIAMIVGMWLAKMTQRPNPAS